MSGASRESGRRRASWLLVTYLLVAGLFLLLVPWTRTWEWNPFLRSVPGLTLGLSPYLRGAVSGLGAFLFVLGLFDLQAKITSGDAPRDEPDSGTGDEL